ncbi:sugar kinase [Thalassotalea fonticola]|uniref:Sugar kinase n=1 Tax=Thalassotalea fonticola TaxID=3065649 RepID=A0ABZ0GKK7_9GAMM|nr:sugar kinase [Colwelliaceae bacterium S1-1]
MSNFVVMGECMVEFSPMSSGDYRQSFAGDIYNTAVYLKRLNGDDSQVSILTGIGNDSLSEQMLTRFTSEQLNIDLVQTVADRILGAYLINISAEGERSFVYWRETSAAKRTLSFLSEDSRAQLLANTNTFYFSGISLAIIEPEERELFWQLLQDLQSSGVDIVFDSNYRPRLWQSQEDAIEQYEQALKYSNIVFAGVEDFELLNGFNSYQQISLYLSSYEIDELIIKNGAQGVMCLYDNEQDLVAVTPVKQVVDSTSAGDSFNAGYLSARSKGQSVVEAVKLGCKVSGLVIQHKGAIVAAPVFSDFMLNLK